MSSLPLFNVSDGELESLRQSINNDPLLQQKLLHAQHLFTTPAAAAQTSVNQCNQIRDTVIDLIEQLGQWALTIKEKGQPITTPIEQLAK